VWRPQRGELGSDTGFVGISIACSSSVSLVPPQWRPRPARGWQRSPGPRVLESWPGRAAGVELASDVAANGAAGVELAAEVAAVVNVAGPRGRHELVPVGLEEEDVAQQPV
jgi:hypothetical protein